MLCKMITYSDIKADLKAFRHFIFHADAHMLMQSSKHSSSSSSIQLLKIETLLASLVI